MFINPGDQEQRFTGIKLEEFDSFGDFTYLIDEILPANCLIVLAGREGTGKSVLASEIGKALLMTENFQLEEKLSEKPAGGDDHLEKGKENAKKTLAEIEKKSYLKAIQEQGHSDSLKAMKLQANEKTLTNDPKVKEIQETLEKVRKKYLEKAHDDFPNDLANKMEDALAKTDLDGVNRLLGKYEVIRGGPVLLIDQENPGSILRDRRDKMWGRSRTTGKFVGKRYELELLPSDRNIKLENETTLKPLKEKILQFKPILVVIDSLSTVHKGSENTSQKMIPIIGSLRQLLDIGKGWGMSILVIHHHSKKGEIRGTTAISAGVDVEYSLKEDKDGHLILKSEKTRVKPFGPIRLELDTSFDRLRFRYDGSVPEDMLDELKKILKDNGGMDYKAIAEELFSIFPSLKDGKLRYTLKKWVDEGKLKETPIPNPHGGKPILRYKLP